MQRTPLEIERELPIAYQRVGVFSINKYKWRLSVHISYLTCSVFDVIVTPYHDKPLIFSRAI